MQAEDRSKQLQWLGDQYFAEQRSLRAAEDQLFSWAASIFVGGFGALTGLRGISNAQWGFWWRIIVMVGIVAVIGVILLMAYLIRRNQDQVQAALNDVIAQLPQAGAARPHALAVTDKLYFYVRWGGVGFMGLVTLILIWRLG